MIKFEILFYFSSPDYSLLETKRLDLPEDAPPGEVYNWIVYEHGTNEFINLSFTSMKKEPPLEYRSFKEAELSFDLSEAQLQLHGTPMVLSRQSAAEAPVKLKNMIGEFLLSLRKN